MEYVYIYRDTKALQGSKMNINSQHKREITRLNTSTRRDMPNSPGGTHAHTRGMIPCTPLMSQVIYYTYKTNVQ